MTRAPEKIPDAPRPATARPTIRAFEVGAAPQTVEPISNMQIAVRNTDLTGKKV